MNYWYDDDEDFCPWCGYELLWEWWGAWCDCGYEWSEG